MYIQYLHRNWHPNLTIMENRGGVDDFTRKLSKIGGKATVYLCEGVTCKPPVQSLEELKKIISNN